MEWLGENPFQIAVSIAIIAVLCSLFPGFYSAIVKSDWLKKLWGDLEKKSPIALPEYEEAIKAIEKLLEEIRAEREKVSTFVVDNQETSTTASLHIVQQLWDATRSRKDAELDAYLERIIQKLD